MFRSSSDWRFTVMKLSRRRSGESAGDELVCVRGRTVPLLINTAAEKNSWCARRNDSVTLSSSYHADRHLYGAKLKRTNDNCDT